MQMCQDPQCKWNHDLEAESCEKARDKADSVDLYREEGNQWNITVFHVERETELFVDIQTHDVFDTETAREFAIAVANATSFALHKEAEIEHEGAAAFEDMANDVVAQMKHYGVRTIGELVEAKRAAATKENN